MTEQHPCILAPGRHGAPRRRWPGRVAGLGLACLLSVPAWAQTADLPPLRPLSMVSAEAALARLPSVAVVPRSGFAIPPEVALDVDPAHLDVSSTRARSGEHDLMVPEALDSGLWHRH